MKPPWLKFKNEILGENYDLSVFFLGNAKMKELNSTYRNKNYAANVLSFPLSKNEGEILINKIYQNKKHADYLFIHSILHLAGLKHGKKMDAEETKIMQKIHPGNWEKIVMTS